jgi:hypothetical protein
MLYHLPVVEALLICLFLFLDPGNQQFSPFVIFILFSVFFLPRPKGIFWLDVPTCSTLGKNFGQRPVIRIAEGVQVSERMMQNQFWATIVLTMIVFGVRG